ncbi:hypothetical protein D3C74_406900 [compost metagenome]
MNFFRADSLSVANVTAYAPIYTPPNLHANGFNASELFSCGRNTSVGVIIGSFNSKRKLCSSVTSLNDTPLFPYLLEI